MTDLPINRPTSNYFISVCYVQTFNITAGDNVACAFSNFTPNGKSTLQMGTVTTQ